MRIARPGYYHHMLVVEVIDNNQMRVIHYTQSSDKATAVVASAASSQSGFVAIGEIMEEITSVDTTQEVLELLEYPDGVPLYIGEAAIQRGREMVGEKAYNMLLNNCESFANWCIIDLRVSNQGENAVLIIGIIAIVMFGLGALGLGKALNNKTKSKDSD